MRQAASIPPPITMLNHPQRKSVSADALRLRSWPPYLAVLTWAFTFFNSVRMLSYLPTMWAIQTSGDSSQHSLWTWCTWLGANLTMAAWLHEQNGRRLRRAVAVNLGNATMCAATVVLIAAHRSLPF